MRLTPGDRAAPPRVGPHPPRDCRGSLRGASRRNIQRRLNISPTESPYPNHASASEQEK
jgi:hypothetical protein